MSMGINSRPPIVIWGDPTGMIDATLEYFIDDEAFDKIKITATQHPKCEHLWLGFSGWEVYVQSEQSLLIYKGYVDIITTFPDEPKFLRIIPHGSMDDALADPDEVSDKPPLGEESPQVSADS